jgi:hypothetical protein
MRASFVFVLFVTAACGGDDAPTSPGAQTLPPSTPPPSGSTTTQTTCSSSDPCDYWFCRCDDGAVVNAAYCNNGYCSTADAICPTACTSFQHGGWTGVAGGGPDQPQPPSSTCGGLGSSNGACNACFEDECCAQGSACGSNSGCLDAWDCIVACNGDFACRATCEDNASSSGLAAYEALESCLLSACGGECS